MSQIELLDESGNIRSLKDIEKEVIKNALAVHMGRMATVARRLKIGRSTLYRKIKEYGLHASFNIIIE